MSISKFSLFQLVVFVLALLVVGMGVLNFLRPLVWAANFAVTGRALVENTGAYLDFNNYNSNVRINMTHHFFSGYVFSEDLGWIDFGDFDNPSGPVAYDSGTGLLSGKAYALEAGGYLDFDNFGSQVYLDLGTGQLSGYVFSEDIGWINFSDPGVVVDADFPVDNVEPIVNASNIELASAKTGGHQVLDSGWLNSFAPYFSWDAGQDNDGGVGLLGYCLYLGTGASEDPGNHLSQSGTSGLLINSPVNTLGTDCSFIVAEPELDLAAGDYLSQSFETGQTYYLRIKAIDRAGNTYNQDLMDGSAAESFEFSFDSLEPTNVGYISPAAGTFNNIADMNFSWPTSGAAASTDLHAGVLGWQYKIGDGGVWRGPTSDDNLGLSYIPLVFDQPYHLSAELDGEEVVIGNNIVYFRTVDLAGNFSPPATYRTGSLAYGGDAPLFADSDQVSVTPAEATENLFALSWPAAVPAEEREVKNYYYMINTTPPANLSTLTGNPGTYFATTGTSVDQTKLPGVQKGSNVVRVVAVDDADNYSPSNFISGNFVLNSSNPDPAQDLTVSDASIKAAKLWRAGLAWSDPEYQGTGELTYLVERSSDGQNWTQITTTSGTAYVDTVPDSKKYYWRVGTIDTSEASIGAPSYTNAVTLLPKGSYEEPADLTSGPDAEGITTRQATIKWTTNRKSDSRVAFGTSSGDYFDEEPSKSDQVTDHQINLTNLLPGTKYYYKVRWTDEDGNTGVSSEKSFTTEPAPTVTDPQATQIGLESAILRYTVTGASSVKIYYGPTTDFGAVREVATSQDEVTMSTELTDLEDGSLYYYKINPVDSEGFEYQGQALTFETMPRPRISNVRLQEVAGSAQTTVLVSWSVNTPLSAIVTYSPTDGSDRSRDQIEAERLAGTREMLISGLLPQRQYQLTVRGRDRAGNEAVSDSYTFTTATDTRPPQIINLKVIGGTIPPVGFAAGEIRAQLVVSWDTDEPATSQVEFGEGTGGNYSQRTQEDGNLKTNHTVIISGLTPSRVYNFRAISRDAAGNEAKSVDMTTIAPKATRSAFDLVMESLGAVFGFLEFLRE